MVDWSYEKSTLQVAGTTIKLDDNIEKVISSNDVVVVLLDYTCASNKNQNIIAFDQNGDQMWRVEPSPGSSEDENPYTGIGFQGDDLIGYTWRGLSVRIDVNTGAWETGKLSK
jgi:hypothetical protein